MPGPTTRRVPAPGRGPGPAAGAALLDQLRQVTASARALLAEADPSACSGADAAGVVTQCCELERLSAAGKLAFARRVEETEAFSATGHRNCAEWLGAVSGERSGRARTQLDTAAKLQRLPEVESALRHGEVSGDQARVILDAGSVDPDAAGELLAVAMAGRQSFAELEERATAVRMAALSKEAQAERRARVHRQRSVRAAPEATGGIRGTFFFPEDDWGRCLAAIGPLAEQMFRAARATGKHEPHHAYLADALVAACTAGVSGGDGAAQRTAVHIYVDAAALKRGVARADERCEIDGVGPVSVAVARDLLGDAYVDLLVRDGCDIVNVTSSTRSIPSRVLTALRGRDRHCRWPGCRATLGLENHHWSGDFSLGEVTALSTLVRLCRRHHALCTDRGWRVEPDGEGTFRAVEPDSPVSGDLARRRRRLSVLRAEARRTRSDEGPARRSPLRC